MGNDFKLFVALLFLAVCSPPSATAEGKAQGPKAKWELHTKLGPSDCPGYSNGSQCQLVCIHSVGEDRKGKYNAEMGCAKAKYIDNQVKFNALLKRIQQVEKAMNKPGFKGWSADQLQDGFYSFAEKIAPQTRQTDSSSPAADANQ